MCINSKCMWCDVNLVMCSSVYLSYLKINKQTLHIYTERRVCSNLGVVVATGVVEVIVYLLN